LRLQPVGVPPRRLAKKTLEPDVEVLLPTIRELGIGFVAYSPLGRGFLAGAVNPAVEYEEADMRRRDPRRQPGKAASAIRIRLSLLIFLACASPFFVRRPVRPLAQHGN
jgi:hypothetical protein